jgi:hypothetical protein
LTKPKKKAKQNDPKKIGEALRAALLLKLALPLPASFYIYRIAFPSLTVQPWCNLIGIIGHMGRMGIVRLLISPYIVSTSFGPMHMGWCRLLLSHWLQVRSLPRSLFGPFVQNSFLQYLVIF